ncbi:MAG: flagellar biosynthetic protein FliQ [Planctomycetota bacterium]|nr:MAG: flagellar biosynthetic protein FliQ [Planctomycetota bacterium]
MDATDAVEMVRQALWVALLISAPVLVAGMLVGLVIGFLQALTQIQEQTVAFVPKIVVMAIVLMITLPWVLIQLLEYSHEVIANIPAML